MNKIKPYIAGILIGAMATVVIGAGGYVVVKKSKPLIKKVLTKLSDMKFARVKKTTKEFSIADFETPEDFKKFEGSGIEISASGEYPSNGIYSAKVIFKKSKAPSFKIEHYFEKDRSFSNWAPYGSFLFDIYNPQASTQRFILQIKDKSGEKVKQDIYVEPNAKETVEIETSVLRHHISIYNIAQINLFRWEPGADSTFYIDNLRLVPERIKTKKTIFDPEFSASKEPAYATGDYFAFPQTRWKTAENKYQFPIRVINTHSIRISNFLATGGVPFPRGQLKSNEELIIKDASGNIVPSQSKVMARWNDGSIKWLLLNIPASAQPNTGAQYYATFPVKSERATTDKWVTETAENILIDTGKIKFSVNKKAFRLFDKVWIEGKEVVSEGSDLVLKFRGTPYRSSLDKNYQLTIEEEGPLTATLKAEGWFVAANGKKFCKFLVRIKVFKDDSFVRVYHTFIYTGYPENTYHYLYKGMRLPKNETIEEVTLDLRIPELIKNSILTFAADGKLMQLKNAEEDIGIIQDKDDTYRIIGLKKTIGSGQKLEGWVDLTNQDIGITAIVRKLWQQYPKALALNLKEKSLQVKLWPAEAGEMDLKTTEKTLGPEDVARGSAFGLAKTHELTFYFHKGDYESSKARQLAEVSQEPPLVVAEPSWTADTRVLGAVSDASKGRAYFQQYEEALERLFGWADRQKKAFRWYGMLNFGDTLSWYRQEGYDDESYDEWGWHGVGRWGWFNCEGVGTHTGTLLQFLRTGDYKYFEFGEDLSRHMMDIDTCHFNTVAYDKRLKRIYQDYSQPGSMHRHSGDHWGGRNEEASHTNLNGILLYYYLTGNDRALDVAKEIGEFFLKHPITYFKHPDVAPNRAMSNIMMGEAALYETTGDARLKKDADYWANLFFQGQNRNGSFNENYNPRDRRWDGDPHIGYMDGYALPALIDYHKLTGNKAIKDVIIKLTDYLIAHDEYGAIYEGLAYSYFLTGDKKYLELIEKKLESMLASQRRQDDPLWNGMIYQKLYYSRVTEFIYFTPYAFEALLSQQKKQETQN